MQDNSKLVVVTRFDLTPGQKVVQAVHAAVDFVFQHPNRAGPWHEQSNYVAILCVWDEKELLALAERCKARLLDFTIFREPDLDNSVTAIAIEPSPETHKLTGKLPLLFKNTTTTYDSI